MFPFYNPQQHIYYQNIDPMNQYYNMPIAPYHYYQNFNANFQNNINQISNIIPQTQELIKNNINQNQNLSTPEFPNVNCKQFSCNCINTDCRKQYCICFKNGEVCGSKCGCSNCRNKQIDERNITISRNKNISCNCKKSQCAKKYCECYANGLKCKQNCHCTACKNC